MRHSSSIAVAVSALVISATLAWLPGAFAANPAPIDVGECFAQSLSLSSDGTTGYVGCSEGGLAVVDLASGTSKTVGASRGMPGDVVAGSGFAYATFGFSQRLVKVLPSGASSEIANFITNGSPGALALSPDGTYVVVGVQAATNHLAVVKATGTPAKISLTGTPVHIATFARWGTDYAYVVMDMGGTYSLQKVNLQTRTIDGFPQSIAGTWPVDLTMAPNDEFAYLLQDDGKVLRISTETDSISLVKTIPTDTPKAVAFSPDSSWAYVLGSDSGSNDPEISRIATGTSVITALPYSFSGFAAGIALAPRGNKLYVAVMGQPDQIHIRPITLPSVTDISPALVDLSGGDEITITGSNLTPDPAVTLNGRPCSIIVATATTIRCAVPGGTAQEVGEIDVVVRTSEGRSVDTRSLGYRLNVTPPKSADAFTSSNSALVFFTGSSLKLAFLKGYRISMQTMRPNGSTTNWTVVKDTSGSRTAVTLSRAELRVDPGAVVRFRVATVATTDDPSLPTNPSPWRQMTDAVAAPTDFAASYDKATDFLTMTWKSPSAAVLGGRNVHGYEFQYLWPGSTTWTQLGTPLRALDERAVFSLENVPKGTFKVRIRSISWPEKSLSAWTTEAAIRK